MSKEAIAKNYTGKIAEVLDGFGCSTGKIMMSVIGSLVENAIITALLEDSRERLQKIERGKS